MNGVSEVLRDLSAALSQVGCPWYVSGAQALVAHGVPRTAQDLDVTVDVDTAQVEELVAALTAHGFQLRIDEDIHAWVAQTYVIPIWHSAQAFPVDVVLALSELERSFASRSEVLLLGVSVPVIAVSDLVVSKLLAARPQDIADVCSLLAGGAAVDVEAVESLLATIESGLDLPGLVDLFHSCQP